MICKHCNHIDSDWWYTYPGDDERENIEWSCLECNKINITYVKQLSRSDFHGKSGVTSYHPETDSDGKWGYIDTNGNEIIPHIYNDARDFHKGLASVQKNDKWGVIDKRGNEVIAFAYDYISEFMDGVAYFIKNDKYGVVDNKGEEVSPPVYRYAWFDDDKNLVMYSEGEGALIFDRKSRQISESIKPNYGSGWANVIFNEPHKIYKWLENLDCKECLEFGEYICVENKDGKQGLFNKSGKEILPLIYERIWVCNEKVIEVTKNGKQGLLDIGGKEIIPFIYNVLYGISDGMIRVMKCGKYGFIDEITYQELLPPVYEVAEDFHEGLAAVAKEWCEFSQEGSKWGFIDKQGNEVIPLIYDEVSEFKDGFAYVEKDGKMGIIDKTGKEIVSFEYTRIYDYDEHGFACVYDDNGYNLIDKTGKLVISTCYEIWKFHEGFAWVRLQEYGNYSFVDMTGENVMPPIYDDFGHFSEGLARVKINESLQEG